MRRKSFGGCSIIWKENWIYKNFTNSTLSNWEWQTVQILWFLFNFFRALTQHPVYINDWLYDLSTIGKISYNTKMNYIKAILIFVKYLKTFQHVDDPVKFNSDLDLIVATVEITKLGTFKQISKEQKKKQFEASINDTQVDLGFAEIFAGDAFKTCKNRVRHKLDQDMPLSKNDETFVMRLCMSVIVIKYFQRPGVAANLTSKEYSSQRHKNSVSVYKHKTSGIRPAYFPLSTDDRYWFDVYLTKIRPKRLILLLLLFFI